MATVLWDTYAEAIDVGAEDFVTKPFHLAELSFRVQSIRRVRYLTDELERAVTYIEELEKDSTALQK
jgi:DNA-binding response OmpR family regulator